MKLGEIVLMNMLSLKMLAQHGVVMFNVRDIDLYSDYRTMSAAGMKATYIYCRLAEKYCISERHVRRIISKLNQEVKNTGIKHFV